jgi:uncharacterized protein (TIGR00288 family)
MTSLRPLRAAHAEPPAHAPNAALMIDFDNVTLAIRSDLSNQLRKLLGSDIFKGKVSVQRAYADWRRYPQYIVPLSEASIDLIFAPAFGSNKKNATDIRLAIDALELIFTRPEIGTFILLSGDSDFSSLVLKLKEYGKYVIGVGIRESSSDLLVQNCDEYFSYSELTGLTKQTDLEYPHKDPWELVIEAVSQMKSEGDVMRSDRLKQVMQQLDPSFDEKEAGFSRFSKFVAEAGQRGLLRLTKMENGQYEIDIGTNANVPPTMEGTAVPRRERPARRSAPRARERAAGGGGPGALTLAAAFHLLKETLATLGGLESEVDADRVRDAMIEHGDLGRDPLFERSRFQRLLRQAHDANLIELSKTEDERYVLKLNPQALVEDQPEAGGAGAVDGAEGSAEDGAGVKRRRGRRGGRGRSKGRGHHDDADVTTEAEPASAVEPTIETEAEPAAAAAAAPSEARSRQRNPRFRQGARGVARSSAEAASPAEGASAAPPPPPPRPPVPPPPTPPPFVPASQGRSLRPRSGSRGVHRTPTPTLDAPSPRAAPDRAERPEAQPVVARREVIRPAPAAREGEELAPIDGQPSLLRRVTAALQRAVRGPEGDKPSDS